jgi:hypothetical protein
MGSVRQFLRVARRGITDIKDNVGSRLGQCCCDFRKLIIAAGMEEAGAAILNAARSRTGLGD